LIAIEKNHFEALPGRVYAIGFVRSYAAFLGLDAEIFVARLKAEMGGRDAERVVVGSLPPPKRKERGEAKCAGSGDSKAPVNGVLRPPERKLPWSQRAIAGLVVALLVYSGFYVLSSARHMAPLPVMPVPARLIAEARLTPKLVLPPPLATVEHPARILREPELVPSTEPARKQPIFVQPLPTIEPAPALRPEPVPVPSIEIAPTRPVAVLVGQTRIRAPMPLGRRYGMLNGNSRITLRAHRAIRVAVLGTRKRIFIDRVLGPGDTYRVPNMAGLTLSARDAGAIEVILDDNTLGFAGKDGATASSLSLDPQKIVDRYQRQRG
jgi:cytoskeleton protein RodZ